MLPKLDPARFIWFRAGGDLELHLMLMDEAPADKPHFCLVVDGDLDGLRRRLEEAGVETSDPHRARRPAALHLPRPVREPGRARVHRAVTARPAA